MKVVTSTVLSRLPPHLERSFSGRERAPNAVYDYVSDNEEMVVYEEFVAKTGGRLDALDVTAEVLSVVKASGVSNGSVLIFSPHTTCCVVLAERGGDTTSALELALKTIAPDNGYYAHDDLDIRTENLVDDEHANAPAHIFHVFAGKASECIPIVRGAVALGPEQRVLFLELDCSRERRYLVQVVGE